MVVGRVFASVQDGGAGWVKGRLGMICRRLRDLESDGSVGLDGGFCHELWAC